MQIDSIRLLVCGDREWTDRKLIRRFLKTLKPIFVIEGEAKGADTIARQEAEAIGIQVMKFHADWNRYGKAAGMVRNAQMISKGNPNMVIAFHRSLMDSKGTKDMVEKSIKAKILTLHITADGECFVCH